LRNRKISGLLSQEEASMSWAGPEDVYLSTSLASYLDSMLSLTLFDDSTFSGGFEFC
jgi:hypothetical protein